MKKVNPLVRRMPLAVFMSFICVGLLMLSSVPAQTNSPDRSSVSEGIILGYVTDSETGDPIADCQLTLSSHDEIHKEYSDSRGLYTFTNVPICYCLKDLSAEKEGYESQTKTVAVYMITYVDFALIPVEGGNEPFEGIIIGFVTDSENGNPISDAIITLKYHEEVHTKLTDSSGYYEFANVPICFCLKNVSASKRGYEGEYQMVAVSEQTYVNFSLEPKADDESDDVSEKMGNQIGFVQSEAMFTSLVGIVLLLAVLLIGSFGYIQRKKKKVP